MGIDELWEILLFHKNAEVNSKMRLCADVLKTMFFHTRCRPGTTCTKYESNKEIKYLAPGKRSPVAALPHFNSCCYYYCCCCSLWSKTRTTGKHKIYHLKHTRANVRMHVCVNAHNQTTHKRLFVVFRK